MRTQTRLCSHTHPRFTYRQVGSSCCRGRREESWYGAFDTTHAGGGCGVAVVGVGALGEGVGVVVDVEVVVGLHGRPPAGGCNGHVIPHT